MILTADELRLLTKKRRASATFVQHMRSYQFKLVAQGWYLV